MFFGVQSGGVVVLWQHKKIIKMWCYHKQKITPAAVKLSGAFPCDQEHKTVIGILPKPDSI